MAEKTEAVTEKDTEKGQRFFWKKDNLVKLVVLIGILGIGLIFFSSLGRKQTAPEESSSLQSEMQLSELEEYRERLTQELGNMVSSIEGAGRTRLMVTLDGTVRSIYASDSDISARQSTKSTDSDEQNNEKNTCVLLRRKDGSEEALTVGQQLPKIRGVLVVCDGGDSQEVSEEIRSAVAAVLNISGSRICVSKMA